MSFKTSNFSSLPDQILPSNRREAVLSAVIKEHLLTGEPVGSSTVAEKFARAAGWSSATIRNLMGDLEEAGFVEQPHTSAGRVPTDKGYRFYVDNLMGVLSLSGSDLDLINRSFGFMPLGSQESTDNVMEKTSRLLSGISQNIGIVVSPSLAQDRLQHIEFVSLPDKKVLVVLVSAPNIVHNKIIRLKEPFLAEELESAARYLNIEFQGKSLAEIRGEILRRMHEEKALYDRLLQNAMILCCGSIEDEEDSIGEVYVEGTSHILAKSDFAGDVGRLRELLSTIEERSRLVQILNECIDRDANLSGNVRVVIGQENAAPSLRNCALITAPYRFENSSTAGMLSVLGPTRIEYARIIAIVGYVAKMLEKSMSDTSPNS
ncbi:MAG TPA: heat-inducible transcriptional repressor HrcA [Pyrinomonadaceae bacterium]|jgi:heat-inducible transcriptional repressor|nr:heat-inducible transcriptional repressor HrcA [Pyrinomonadaceae bacterium]